jgi:hypothetical protein
MKGPIVVCTLLVCRSMHADADVDGDGHHRLLGLLHAILYGGALLQSYNRPPWATSLLGGRKSRTAKPNASAIGRTATVVRQ